MSFNRSVTALNRPGRLSAPHIRGWLIVATAVAAGLVAGYAASNGTGPFSGLRPYVASHLVRSDTTRTPIDASTLFPSPKPPAVIHQVVPIYYTPVTKVTQSGGGSVDPPGPTPKRSPRPSPSPSPGGGDD